MMKAVALLCSIFAVSSVYGGLGVGYSANAQSCLTKHNYYRHLHRDTPSMSWDSSLAAGAQAYAQKLANSGSLQHSRGNYGENLYMAWGGRDFSNICNQAVDSWYKEKRYYNYGNPKYSSKTGHFTQVVWRKSTKLGVGIGQSGSRVVVVARYSPAGNYGSQFKDNVMRTK